MSESVAALHPVTPRGDPYLEQRIYIWSPFGTLGTTVALFAFVYGAYLLAAWIEGAQTLVWTGRHLAFDNGAWPAMVLSLLICAALGMQRYARLKDAEDYHHFAPVFTGGEATASALGSYAPDDAQLGRASLAGAIIGILISAVILNTESISTRLSQAGTTGWLMIAIILLSVLFARGAELTRKASASFAITLRDELKIDLLRIDKLSVIGRSAARTALIWIVISAIAGLFFVGGDISVVSVATMVTSGALGIVIFLRAIMGVHEKIVAAKAAELEHVRCQIETARAALAQDDHAATRLQGLLAYEHRVEQAQEWPFDQTTIVRVAASTLIVTVPWFGQAVAGYFIEHLAH
ncbi:MAG TPA: hypothetical protein VGH02_15625 [Rhizomicrobium sp.]|jgi:hypothetical protein